MHFGINRSEQLSRAPSTQTNDQPGPLASFEPIPIDSDIRRPV
jgi:hypothetical protein